MTPGTAAVGPGRVIRLAHAVALGGGYEAVAEALLTHVGAGALIERVAAEVEQQAAAEAEKEQEQKSRRIDGLEQTAAEVDAVKSQLKAMGVNSFAAWVKLVELATQPGSRVGSCRSVRLG